MRRQPRLPLQGASARAWTLGDAPALVVAHRDPLVRRYATTPLTDRAAAAAAVSAWAGLWADEDGVSWALCGPSGDVLGGLTFVLRDRTSRRGEAGYWLAPDARGRGLASAALAAGTDVVVRVLGWHRVDVSHAVENGRSCAVARRAGYAGEGVLREAQFYPDAGRWSDEHLHGYVAETPSRD